MMLQGTVGLIIGKFMPLTRGHIALIDFGINNCDKLYIAVCTLKKEPIDGALRYNWVKEYYKNNNKVEVIHITEEIPGSGQFRKEDFKLWADYMKKLLPPVNIIFASEQYGEYLAKYMNADFMLFDAERKIIPISATKIRSNPFMYWEFIPDIVKPYYAKKEINK